MIRSTDPRPGAIATPTGAPARGRASRGRGAVRVSDLPAHVQSPDRRVDVGGVEIDVLTESATVATVMRDLAEGRGGVMVTVNLDHVRRCRSDAAYRDLVARSELVVADGMPLVWASRVQGTPLPERVAGSNLVWSLCRECAAGGRRVFLLGGDPGAAEGARSVLESTFSGLRVCGVLCPERGFERDEARLASIEGEVVSSGADVVFVALGSPKQEYLGERLHLAMPRAWFVGCGISLSFVAGQVSRAPMWMQRCGLEWAHRLAQEPRRLARRYLIDGMAFGAVLMGGAVWRRASGWGRRPAPGAGRLAVIGRSGRRRRENLARVEEPAGLDAGVNRRAG